MAKNSLKALQVSCTFQDRAGISRRVVGKPAHYLVRAALFMLRGHVQGERVDIDTDVVGRVDFEELGMDLLDGTGESDIFTIRTNRANNSEWINGVSLGFELSDSCAHSHSHCSAYCTVELSAVSL